MPEDEEHVIYVWIDALFNYATALGLAEANSERTRPWALLARRLACHWQRNPVVPRRHLAGHVMALDLPWP